MERTRCTFENDAPKGISGKTPSHPERIIYIQKGILFEKSDLRGGRKKSPYSKQRGTRGTSNLKVLEGPLKKKNPKR